jgi:hypothetical protein
LKFPSKSLVFDEGAGLFGNKFPFFFLILEASLKNPQCNDS